MCVYIRVWVLSLIQEDGVNLGGPLQSAPTLPSGF